jgi:hypothetical protein
MAQNTGPATRSTNAASATFKEAIDDFISKRPYTALLGMFTAGFLYALIRR